MSAAAAGPFPAGDIMSNKSSLSPTRNIPQRTGRHRLVDLLKPSPPGSRTASPKAPDAIPRLDRGHGAATKTTVLAGKSRNTTVEVFVGTSSPTRAPASPVDASSPRTPIRSPTSPNVASSPLREVTSDMDTAPEEPVKEDSGLQKSASDINLVDLRARSETVSSHASGPSIRSAVSETGLATMMGNPVLERPKAAATIGQETKISRRQSITNRLRGRQRPGNLPVSLEPPQSIAELPKAILSPRERVSDPIEEKGSTISKMARRTSWIIGSRSPSPSNKKLLRQKKSMESTRADSPAKSSMAKSSSVTDFSKMNRSDTSLNKKSGRRPLSAIITRSNSFVGGQRPRINLPKSASTDRLPTPTKRGDEVPEMPKGIPKSKLQLSAPETPRKKDELWTAFRTLDSEFQKFSSKPSSLKTQVVRAGLLPFLKNTSEHPSTKGLRADDLDKRINVLNKWWIGLLEILNGRNGQSVSPNDRPAILDGVAGIMTRPEWRLSLSTIAPRSTSRVPNSRSTSSLESSSSDFLAESVLHNVRNIFVQNLLSQMAFVIERMSMRSVPASVVNFCGKACAYAFFFCPGVAEILVRLWSPPPDAIKRVLKEAGVLDRNHDTSYASDILSRGFPAHLQTLSVSSFPSLMRYLRSKPKDNIPLSSAYIPWNGPWVGRWAGRDSDLFFNFTKTAIALICELLPENISQADWVCVPCAALIQAQLLSVMDATIHRGGSHDSTEGLPPPTFDDVLGTDAVIHPLPARAPNTIRIMAENRLVMLLRECLFSPAYTVKPHVRRTVAHLYGNLIKATTRRVSLYDHNACFTLCDFLDETINILGRFYKDEFDPAGWLDWPFWFDVFKKMGSSNNTMIEVRLFTFIYGMWGFLTKNDERKKEICVDWLLEESFFNQHFNHWCPMVRSYYMRLLCWRIAREDGEADETNMLIYETLLARTQKAYSWFLASQDSSHTKGTVPLSSVPATPAPGRRLLIVRNDSLPTSNNSWDSLVAAASSSSQPKAYQRYSSLNPLLHSPEPEKPAAPVREASAAKKGWLRKINPFATTDSNPPTPLSEAESESVASTQSEVNSIETASLASKRLSTMSGASSLTSGSIRGWGVDPEEPARKRPQAIASFKFSLEWVDKATLSQRNRRIYPPQLPVLAQQLLDARMEDRRQPEREESEGTQAAPSSILPLEPKGSEIGQSKYCGRALAEWDGVTKECHGFYERRRVEGVTDIKWMEVPTMGVESFRRPVG